MKIHSDELEDGFSDPLKFRFCDKITGEKPTFR